MQVTLYFKEYFFILTYFIIYLDIKDKKYNYLFSYSGIFVKNSNYLF